MLYTYKMPTELFFGRGAAEKTGEKVKEIGGINVLLVADRGVVSAGILSTIEKSFEANQISYAIFSDFESDPDVIAVEAGVNAFRKQGADAVVGVGGGSSMDCGKAIAAMANNEGKIYDYIGLQKVPNPSVPFIAIPTTAGTGSEATYWAVISDHSKNMKTGIGGWNMMPAMAIMDPLLTVSMPPSVTAFTGMDALTHAMESYVCKANQPVSEGLSFHAMKLIARSLRIAVTNGDNLDAREDMQMASLIAALAFNVTRLGNAHALVMPLGSRFGVPHGEGNAILLPHVMEFNYLAAPKQHIEIARLFGENTEGLPESEAAYLAVIAVKKLLRDIGITHGLSKYGVREEHLADIAKEAYTSGNVPVNPRNTTVDDLVSICRKACDGI
ncbi:MAG: iron-containing alcohol dehydrogenase [Acetivibrionales bacterium]|jgi:alcohol dehydrogenase class IV